MTRPWTRADFVEKIENAMADLLVFGKWEDDLTSIRYDAFTNAYEVVLKTDTDRYNKHDPTS